jgi:hypothetical protein
MCSFSDILQLTQSPDEVSWICAIIALFCKDGANDVTPLYSLDLMRAFKRILSLGLEFQDESLFESIMPFLTCGSCSASDIAPLQLYKPLLQLAPRMWPPSCYTVMHCINVLIAPPELISSPSEFVCPCYDDLVAASAVDALVSVLQAPKSPEVKLLALAALFTMHAKRELPDVVKQAVPNYRDPLPFSTSDQKTIALFLFARGFLTQ